ncbi:nuclear pore complex protein Nup50 [Trematomus bernacchii]|uniref:nuclear pore complex protein Nup50 n=1 Tax=Trematomus bernacchii TaxID=40690 RepID=UPI00146F61FA|nr:nuclear pore complex protein Nup50 [Trematomus bernacchii]
MAKRIADKELTDRNWDQEEEGEEAGTFLVATEDVLKSRAIKKAKRRNIGEAESGGSSFKGFKGFSLTPALGGGPAPTGFSGFGNGGGGFTGLSGSTNGSSSTPASTGFFSPASTATTPGLTFSSDTKQTNGSSPSSSSSSSSSSRKEYSRQLTALNCSVRDWITKHVNDNPLCDLNPIFRDYEKHLGSIERQYGEKKKDPLPPPTVPLPLAASSSSSSSPFSFTKTPAEETNQSVTFNFGQKVDSSVVAALASKPPPSFSFSSSSSSSSSSGLFGGDAFSAPKTEAARPTDENGEEETDEPPKVDVKEVKEDDAFYSKKCKLFYKKDSEFKEKGVGTLHLKKSDDNKVQLLIRADTNLGHILLNILLQASLPVSRLGKNNVMVVCVPNPPVDEKNPSSPVPLLIRLKTSEDADQLHKLLEEKKA